MLELVEDDTLQLEIWVQNLDFFSQLFFSAISAIFVSTSFLISMFGDATFFTTEEKKGRVEALRYIIWTGQHLAQYMGVCGVLGKRTEMTFLNPSKTSLSFRLSSSFLICAAGRVLVELRELRAD
ncbi:hypothetical protein M7I_2424 [Glarea lozoyensis 74030]|uniref:Uncharacterized protein n=1 Tax=Glarea lozoyensis (strain ATCC 74030 / MF5533) TaxID=1104152 RepID=H0EIR0_GLAL7|nr:hypothetical protein M7I_2424 [Glarea lozoyensis 74030]